MQIEYSCLKLGQIIKLNTGRCPCFRINEKWNKEKIEKINNRSRLILFLIPIPKNDFQEIIFHFHKKAPGDLGRGDLGRRSLMLSQ